MADKLNQSPGSSPSKAIDDNAKRNWKGGLDHGVTNAGQALSGSYNKHPVSVPKGGKGIKK